MPDPHAARGRPPERSAVNHVVDGSVSGIVVQAQAIYGDVRFASAEPREPKPQQLPPLPAHFTSRVAELETLDRIAADLDGDPAAAAVAVVVGPGGVGKTAMAVTWTARNAERFPDGQLYADLRGFSPETALTPGEVLGAFLRAFGMAPERVPADLAEQAALFRTVTVGKRLAVVVDNAMSVAQVRPLIPASSGCMVVVTSRLRLDGLAAEGARFVDMAPLPQSDAIALLTRSIGEARAEREQPDVAELASLCGRLPIALRVAGARLASRPQWQVARVVAELSDERVRLRKLSTNDEASVTATFDWSYRALPPRAARLYRLLSEHPGPDFGHVEAAAATGLSEDAAADALQLLSDASLLEEADQDRYRFHDLVRLHGRAQADDERGEVVERIAQWYLHQFTRANMVVIPIRWRVSEVCLRYQKAPAAFASGAEALDWLDARLSNVLALLRETSAQGRDVLAWQLCESLWELFLHRKHYPQWLGSHEIGIGAARRCGDVVAESRLRCQLARAYLDLGRLDAAEKECLLAADLARGAGSRHNESVALDQLGMVAQGRGEVDAAVAFFRHSLAIETELGIERGVAQRHRRIGEVLLQADRDTEAVTHLDAALKVFAKIGDMKDEAKVMVALSRIEARAGRVAAATRRLERARDLLLASGSVVYQADVLVTFADIAELDGDLVAARRYLLEAAELSRNIGGPRLERLQARLDALAVERDGAERADPPTAQQP